VSSLLRSLVFVNSHEVTCKSFSYLRYAGKGTSLLESRINAMILSVLKWFAKKSSD
jgi:hypothetical protein